MKILDRIANFLERRELAMLRKELAQKNETIIALEFVISEHAKTIKTQIMQIYSANHIVSYTTRANLDLKQLLRDNGINADNMNA